MSKKVYDLVHQYDELLSELNNIVVVSIESAFESLFNSFPEYYPATVNKSAGFHAVVQLQAEIKNLFDQHKVKLGEEIKAVSFEPLDPFNPFSKVTPFKTNRLELQRKNYPDSYASAINISIRSIKRGLDSFNLIISSDFPQHNHFSISSLFKMSDECTEYVEAILKLENEIKKEYAAKRQHGYSEALKAAKSAWLISPSTK